MFSSFIEKAMRLKERAVEDYRRLHNNAEEGLHLPKTISYVKEQLRGWGYAPRELAGGVIAEAGCGEKCILLRADMDALPIEEKSGLDFACKSGFMHACGHDMHTTMLLLASRLIKAKEKELKNKVVLCFQPGEETLEGAKEMIEADLLRGVNCAAMIHVLTATEHKTGTVIIPPSGIGAAGADFFRVTVNGKGCHGSTPYLGIDPLTPLCKIADTLSSLIAREVRGDGGDMLTVGRISAGDTANVIPEKGELLGTLRSYRDENRDYIKNRLREVCESTAKAHRCTATVEYLSGAPSFINDETLVKRAKKIFENPDIPAYEVPEGQRGGGSEDFAYVSRTVPSIMLCISAGSLAEGYTEPLHSPKVRFNTDAIPYGAAAYASMAFLLSD